MKKFICLFILHLNQILSNNIIIVSGYMKEE